MADDNALRSSARAKSNCGSRMNRESVRSNQRNPAYWRSGAAVTKSSCRHRSSSSCFSSSSRTFLYLSFHDETSWISSRYQILVQFLRIVGRSAALCRPPGRRPPAACFCYCSTHRYRNIGGRFSASLARVQEFIGLPTTEGFPHWKIEGSRNRLKKPTLGQ